MGIWENTTWSYLHVDGLTCIGDQVHSRAPLPSGSVVRTNHVRLCMYSCFQSGGLMYRRDNVHVLADLGCWCIGQRENWTWSYFYADGLMCIRVHVHSRALLPSGSAVRTKHVTFCMYSCFQSVGLMYWGEHVHFLADLASWCNA